MGGQAVVWSALSSQDSCIYAIKFNKILDSDLTHGEEIGIEQKLEKLVGLQHPHILPLQEYGTEERVRYMVSPYVPGGTLTHRLRTEPLLVDDVLRYGNEIASALDYLHSQGVIHRDIKSSNILLDLSDHTYLADFGLARLVSTSTLAFHTGHGTPPYAPPEQIRSQEITFKSDIFSFGILLFEMFTGQLPWNGQRQLGVEQLHSAQELPDPCEYVPGLPALITEVLRRVTSADPVVRPRSAREVVRMLHYVFKRPEAPQPSEMAHDARAARSIDAEELLKQALSQWESSQGRFTLSLTKFALIDQQGEEIGSDSYQRFMLAQSLTYGHNDDRWWTGTRNPRDRLQVSASLLERDNEVIAARVLEHLRRDTEILASPRGLPSNMARALLAIGLKTKDLILRHTILTALRLFVPPASAWTDPSLSPDQLTQLGRLALEDSESGDRAAELVGHLRTPSAVHAILKSSVESRKIDALLLVQSVAGSLPGFVPTGVRFRLQTDWILQRLTQQPVNLVGAYMLASLGAALGVALQNYLTIYLPNYFDIARITTSLERGLITGSVFGMGIFLARVSVERFHGSNFLLRLFFGTVGGGLGINLAFLIFHMLFLNTPPRGFLITLGCLLIALSFAVGGLVRSRPIKMMIAFLSIVAAIFGSWLIHQYLLPSLRFITPLFMYDYNWPVLQVLLTALGVSLLIALFGNLLRLDANEE